MARLIAAGYSEVILPILDYLEPYESLLTPATRGELYRFVDRDGELLALRADFTPMLARLLAPRLASLALPLRLYYRGDVMRYQEERAGGRGSSTRSAPSCWASPAKRAEREVLRLFLELATAGDGRAGSRWCSASPGRSTDCCWRRARRIPARLAAAVARRERGEVRRARPTLLEVVENGVAGPRPRSWSSRRPDRLRGLQVLRDELAADFPGVRLTIDLAEFACSSLDPLLAGGEGDRPYYDGLVFHAYAGPAALPVGGGGRYDRLFRALGAEVPAAGFSLSLERLLEASA